MCKQITAMSIINNRKTEYSSIIAQHSIHSNTLVTIFFTLHFLLLSKLLKNSNATTFQNFTRLLLVEHMCQNTKKKFKIILQFLYLSKHLTIANNIIAYL